MDSALLTASTPYAAHYVQCYRCDGYGHIHRDCPDKLIPKEELQRRKHPRLEDPASTHNMDRGRGRGRYNRGGRSPYYRSRGRYRGRGRGRHQGNTNPYRPTTTAPVDPEGHAALVIIDDGVNEPTTHSMSDFDWLSLGNFQPMENTMDLGRRIEDSISYC